MNKQIPSERKTPTRKIVGGIMLAIGAGLLIIAVAVFLDAPQNIYGIEELWFSIGAGFISVILILIGLGLVFSKYTDVPPDEPGEE